MTVAEEPLDMIEGYPLDAAVFDEAVDHDGRPREPALGAFKALAGHGLAELVQSVSAGAAAEGVCFHSVTGDQAFVIDPVPRVLSAAEWAPVEAGLVQRVRALNAFVADVYAEARIVKEGVVPARVIETAPYYEPLMRGIKPPGGVWIGIAGLDLVRDDSGRFLVLEDNVRTPSGFSYAAAARRALVSHLDVAPEDRPLPLDGLAAMLEATLRACSPATEEPRIAVLTDGEHNAAYYEHAWAAGELGVPLLEPHELDLDSVDVLYRRTNADRIDTEVGAQLLEAMREGSVGVVNAFGTGVADDKLTHAYVEDMVRFYLGEEPTLPSVETFDLGRADTLERAFDVFEELVIKPRGGYGGVGVVILPHAERKDVEATRAAVLESPGDFVAQRMVMLSTHPTVVDSGALAPRHVDLRPYVFLTGENEGNVMPGGLTRVAFDEGALVVNSSQNGGAKDTWVLPR